VTATALPRHEELANSLTHGLGAVLGCAALVLLVVFASLRGNAWHIVSCSIYGVTLVLLYTFSTLYHFARDERAKRRFRTLDRAAIFLLIAGTYTPLALVTLRGGLGWALLVVLWGIAAVGIVLELVQAKHIRTVSLPLYLAMGWAAVLVVRPLMAQLPPAGLAWIAAGGLAYTTGTVFYALKRVPYAHTVWHLFVLAGSTCHFLAVLLYVVPRG
jgi:hemolysin III